jgi:glycosyltransferase involved in cell wall biosynthesis
MAERARQRVEQTFSWTNIARQTLGFYQELVARRK